MARAFALGNRNILVCLDKDAQIRDFYYPYVGQENHVHGKMHRFGTWVDGQFDWFESDDWQKKLSYKKDSLVTEVCAINNKLKLEIIINDTVHYQKNIFLRKIRIKNFSDKKQDIKLFLHQVFQIAGSSIGNTVYYNPQLKALVFYKDKNYFLINGLICNSEIHGITDYATGAFESRGLQGTYIDAEDGKLSNNPIEHGSVDSTISFEFVLDSKESKIVYYWVCAGEKNTEITELNEFVIKNKPEELIDQTGKYWQAWVNKYKFDFFDLNENIVDLFKRSLLLVSTHVDRHGAFIASGDSDTLFLKKDTYAYMWPRDGALIARSLDRAGYQDITQEFFGFCCKAMTKDGYLFHKYNANGSLGSSWHAWIHEGHFQLPIQEDQGALVLDALWKHYAQYKNDDYIKTIFDYFIKPSANFMCDFMDEDLGLPKESYDLWEEKLGIHTFTCATVYAGLKAAYNFTKIFGDISLADKYLHTAETIKENIIKHLYDPEEKFFIKGLYYKDGQLKRDCVVDSSSCYGIFEYKVLPVDDQRVKSSMAFFRSKLTCSGSIGGYARYENDNYYRVTNETTGNPWFITSLWLAEYYIDLAKNLEDLKPAVEIFGWVNKYKMETGVLSEQLNPKTGEPLSVAPLTWSHAGFIIAVNKYLDKLDRLGICKMCNPPKIKTNNGS